MTENNENVSSWSQNLHISNGANQSACKQTSKMKRALLYLSTPPLPASIPVVECVGGFSPPSLADEATTRKQILESAQEKATSSLGSGKVLPEPSGGLFSRRPSFQSSKNLSSCHQTAKMKRAQLYLSTPSWPASMPVTPCAHPSNTIAHARLYNI
jgi:hypothetical protein